LCVWWWWWGGLFTIGIAEEDCPRRWRAHRHVFPCCVKRKEKKSKVVAEQ